MENKKISQLVSAGTLNGSELVEVVKNGANYKTTSQSVADLSKTYTVYTAYVTQSAMNAPTATVLENTTDEVFTYEYISSGSYKIIKSGNLFNNSKSIILHTPYTQYWITTIIVNGIDYIQINTADPANNVDFHDDLLNGVIEIRIYN